MSDSSGAKEKHGFKTLLFFLLVYIFGSPFLTPYPSLAIIAHSMLSTALFFSVWAVEKRRNYRSISMTLLVPVLGIYWLGIYDIIPFSYLAAYILLAIFFALLIVSFTIQISKTEGITVHVIFATLCLYLIIGLLWGSLYSLLYELDPGSFTGVLLEYDQDGLLTAFNYFSMVTLTTLGYGDITPQSPGAGALCQVEAIVGQFYTAVVVAWLVGNFVSERQRTNKKR